MARFRLKLVSGREYLFTHRRLRIVKARFIRIVRAPGSDPADEFYLECSVAETDPAFRPPSLRGSDTLMLRPSMVSMVQDVPPGYTQPVLEFAGPMTPRRGRPAQRIVQRVQRLIRAIRSR